MTTLSTVKFRLGWKPLSLLNTWSISDSLISAKVSSTKQNFINQNFANLPNLPKFINFIDTTNTPYYGTSKFLSNLLNTTAENDYVVQDFFFAVKKIRKITKELFEDGYRYVLFDAESLLTSY